MVARRVVAAHPHVVVARPRRRNVAMPWAAIACAVAEDGDVPSEAGIVADRGGCVRPRVIEEGAHEAGAQELWHLVQANFGPAEASRRFRHVDRLREETTNGRLQ